MYMYIYMNMVLHFLFVPHRHTENRFVKFSKEKLVKDSSTFLSRSTGRKASERVVCIRLMHTYAHKEMCTSAVAEER